jgi:ABC-2 type transport system permease protein
MSGLLDEYGGDYFPFVLLGLAFSTYMMLGLQTFSETIREGQVMGTLEIMLLSPTKLSTILLSSSLWAYGFGSLRVLLFLVFGSLIFGVSFAQANLLTTFVVLILSVLSFASVGIISAAFIMVLKKGDPIAWALSGLSTLLSGVFYPVAVLPEWLQKISAVLPLTYALNAARQSVLLGSSIYEVRFDIFALLIFSAVLLPISLLSFRLAVKRAKVEGSLVQY